MRKNFDGWNEQKKRLDDTDSKLYHERQIWWCALGVNVGFEQDGTGEEFERPILIIKGMSRTTCYVVPLTTSTKKHPLRIPIGPVEGKEATALMSQMRLIDTRRFVNKIGFLDQEIFERIRKAAKGVL